MSTEDRVERARRLYERVVFDGDAAALAEASRELDAVEADLLLARGRIVHARYLEEGGVDPGALGCFERAMSLYEAIGDLRGEAESVFWIGVVHQVVRDDNGSAVPYFERSLDLASQAGDRLTVSYAQRHLGIAAHAAGRLDEARERLEESVRVRRAIGFTAGVAANLVGLIYVAVEQGRRDDASTLAAEAHSIAEAAGARRVLQQVEEARTALEG